MAKKRADNSFDLLTLQLRKICCLHMETVYIYILKYKIK